MLRLIPLIAAAWLAAGPAFAATATLTDTAGDEDVYVYPPPSGTFDESSPTPHAQKRLGVKAPQTLFDFTGEVAYQTHTTLGDGTCTYSGSINIPIRNGDTTDAILSGGRVEGDISLTAYLYDWSQTVGGYCNGTAVLMDHVRSFTQQVQNIRINEVWDGIRFGTTNCWLSTSRCYNRIADVYVSRARDDCIENDILGNLLIVDSLFDKCFSFVSGDSGGGTTVDHTADTIFVVNTRVRLYGWPYDASRAQYHVGPCKLNATNGPSIVFINTVIAFDNYTSNEFAHWNGCKSRTLAASRNNIAIWLGTGSYPASPFPGFHSSFTVIDETTPGYSAQADRLALWRSYCNEWVAEHPTIDVIAGATCSDDP